jgi:glycosyltransferase involved in cell wall biosynthesis
VNRIIVVMSTKSNDGTKTMVENWHVLGVIDKVIYEDVGLAYARCVGIEEVETDWFVFIDGDVVLHRDWSIRSMMVMQCFRRDASSAPYIGAFSGYLYRNQAHLKYLQTVGMLEVTERMYTHNTIVRTEAVRDWKPDIGVNAWEDYLMTQHIRKKGLTCYSIPIFSFHNHQGSVMKAAAWNSAGARYIGKMKKVDAIHIIKKFISSLTNTIKFRSVWFLSYGVKQIIGMVYGFFAWSKFIGVNR